MLQKLVESSLGIAGDWFQDPLRYQNFISQPSVSMDAKPSDMEGRLIRELVFPLFSASWSITTKRTRKKTKFPKIRRHPYAFAVCKSGIGVLTKKSTSVE